jgi:protein-S-isoprenylcysteine O-methyltransferase Ste14
MHYGTVILWSWAAFLIVWAITAFGVKRDVRRDGSSSVWSSAWPVRLVVGLLLILMLLRSGRPHTQPTVFSGGALAFVPSPPLGWTAAVIVVVGICFAVWARLILGKNWSPRPSRKERHELVTNGPYAFVRHPIYSGMLLAVFGTALTGSYFAILVLFLASLVFLARIPREEKIMLELFPNEYPSYQARTKRLIPFVW